MADSLLARSAKVFESRLPRILIGLVAVAAPGLGLVYAPKFLARLQLNINPPQSSAAYKALAAYKAAFPQQAEGTTDSFVLLVSVGGGPVINASASECYVDHLRIASRCPLVGPVERFSISLEAWLTTTLPHWVNQSTFASYYNYHRLEYSLLQSSLLSSPKQPTTSNATIIRIQIPQSKVQGGFTFTQDLAAKVDELVASENAAHAADGAPALAVGLAGMPSFLMAAQNGVKADIEKMDTFSLPLALFIFILMLRSVRLLILPMINIAVVVSASFTLMYPISLYLDFGSTVPSLMLSAGIATSIDYSLFLLSRFREEIERGCHPTHAVSLMMGAAGHTVLVSGTTLALCFGGIAVLPLTMLRTMGIGAGTVCTFSVIVNLTLTPTLLLSFPRFFSTFDWGGCGCVARCLGATPTTPSTSTTSVSTAPLVLNGHPNGHADINGHPIGHPIGHPDTRSGEPPANEPFSSLGSSAAATENAPLPLKARSLRGRSAQFWLRIAGCTQRFAILTIVLIVLAATPFILKVPTLKNSADFALLTPRGAPCSVAYEEIIRTFGSGGADAPYQLLLTPRAADGTVASQTFFDDVNGLVRFFAARNASDGAPLIELHWLLSVTGFALPAWLNHGHESWLPISFNNLTWLENQTHVPGLPNVPTKLGAEMRLLWDQQVSSADGNRTMMLTVRLPFDPFSNHGREWLADMRAAMVDAVADPSCECDAALDVGAMQLAGGGGGILDAISTVYAAMPMVVAITFGAAFAIILLAFRSIFVPLRAVLSIALTVAWVYGVLIWVYQEGGLAWTGISSLQPTPSGICWIVPVITFPILVGLGLDYDVFLLTRVLELRLAGATNTRAVTIGLVRSGNVITAAGLIMAIAFMGLLLNSTPTLNQMAIALVVSVLLDTFVVRTLLLPAIMSLLGPLNWFPRSMPEPHAPEERAALGCSIVCTTIEEED